MTDEQTIKALECCIKGECSVCPLSASVCGDEVVMQYALDLIKRQQAEIERLKRDSIPRFKYGVDVDVEKELLKAEISNLERNRLNNFIKAKNEAYKEFAERLKEKMDINSSGYILITEMTLDNLVKELRR